MRYIPITIFGNIPVLKISKQPKLTNISKVQVISDRIPALYLPNLSPK
jgi:hypothetical protein